MMPPAPIAGRGSRLPKEPPMRPGIALLLALITTTTVAQGAAPRVSHLVESVVLSNYRGNWYTVPTSINNRGEIAGYATRAEDEGVAFIRTASGRYQRIADRGIAQDINNRGVVVGLRFPCNGDDCRTEGFV